MRTAHNPRPLPIPVSPGAIKSGYGLITEQTPDGAAKWGAKWMPRCCDVHVWSRRWRGRVICGWRHYLRCEGCRTLRRDPAAPPITDPKPQRRFTDRFVQATCAAEQHHWAWERTSRKKLLWLTEWLDHCNRCGTPRSVASIPAPAEVADAARAACTAEGHEWWWFGYLDRWWRRNNLNHRGCHRCGTDEWIRSPEIARRGILHTPRAWLRLRLRGF